MSLELADECIKLPVGEAFPRLGLLNTPQQEISRKELALHSYEIWRCRLCVLHKQRFSFFI